MRFEVRKIKVGGRTSKVDHLRDLAYFQSCGMRIAVFRCMVYGVGFGVWGLSFGVWGLGAGA